MDPFTLQASTSTTHGLLPNTHHEAAAHLICHGLYVCPPLELQKRIRPVEVLHVLRQLLQLQTVPELVVAGVGQSDAGYQRSPPETALADHLGECA